MNRLDLIIDALYKVELLFESHGQYPHTLREVNEALAAARELKALKPANEFNPDWDMIQPFHERIKELEAQLAKPEQKLQMMQIKDGHLSYLKKPWVGLSQTEIERIVDSNTREGGVCSGLNIALEIQMRLKEKNNAV